MATLYRERQAGRPWDRAFKTAWKRHCVPSDGTAQTPEQLLLEFMLQGYVEYYGGDRGWEIVAVEVQETIPLTPEYAIKVRADLIVKTRNNGKLWLVDAKTSKNLLSEQDLQMHMQFPIYVWAMREKGVPIWGAIHDNVRTHRNKQKPQLLEERFRRTLLHHTDQELETVVRDALRDIRNARAYLERLERDEVARSDREARTTYPVDMPRHPDPERCRFRCDFTSACMAGMRSSDPTTTRRFLRDQDFLQNFERH